MRNIEITAEQARVILDANNEVQETNKEARVAQKLLDRVLAAVLAGDGILNAEVLRMDTDSDPPVLVIADRANGDGRLPTPPIVAEVIEAQR